MWKEPQERGVTSNWGLRKKTDSGNPEEIAFKAESRSGRRGLFWRGRWEWGHRGRKSRVYLGSRGLLSLLSHREIRGVQSQPPRSGRGGQRPDVEG